MQYVQLFTGVGAVLVKVAALGLDPKNCLGKQISEVEDQLLELRKKFGINVCGEGGEYETVTLDCPLFKFGRICVEEWKTEIQGGNLSPCGWLIPLKSRVESKNNNQNNNKNNDKNFTNQIIELID
eukprot:TRINITY_DN33240_c1_g1_i2.p3 TRINITY_DN33240_c1_g1~~TRINITY_DN33240_c1_g1_i2.p3  ORF type:complete len:126 (-),score=32.15 TRINITY_DN33240_c1_g1_i2:18-395(-)